MISYLEEYNCSSHLVDSVIEKFITVTINEMSTVKNCTHNMEILLREPVSQEKVIEAFVGDMNYMELLTLLEMTKDEKYLTKYNDGGICTPEDFHLFLYKVLILILYSASEQLMVVRMFLDLSLDTYLYYMQEMMQYNKKELAEYSEEVNNNIWDELKRLHKDLANGDTKLKDILLEIKKNVYRDWGIVDRSIESYYERMFAELKLFRRLFGEVLMLAYPKSVDVDYFIEKYTFQEGVGTLDYINALRKLCNDQGYNKYGYGYFEKIKLIVDKELELIAKIPNGARDLVKVSEFMKKVKQYYERSFGEPLFGFRGGINASMVAYLCGITKEEPKEYYTWTCYERVRWIRFDINMSYKLYDKVYNYYNVNIPECATLYSCLDLSIFEYLNEPPVKYSEEESEVILEEFWNRAFFEDDRLNYIYYWREKHVPNSQAIFNYLKESNILPKTKEQLVKIVGFLFSEFDDDSITHIKLIKSYGTDLYEKMISSPENIYEVLVKNGVYADWAVDIALETKYRRGDINLDEMMLVMDCCGEEYMENIKQIKFLFCRTHCTEISNNILHMMRLINEDFEAYKEAYEYFVG